MQTKLRFAVTIPKIEESWNKALAPVGLNVVGGGMKVQLNPEKVSLQLHRYWFGLSPSVVYSDPLYILDNCFTIGCFLDLGFHYKIVKLQTA